MYRIFTSQSDGGIYFIHGLNIFTIMSTKQTYSDLLKNPLWQRKRLEILSRDNFQCVYCGEEKRTLHVHHLTYSGKPWEVADINLLTLCDKCHQVETDMRSDTDHDLVLVLKQKKLNQVNLSEIVGSIIQCDVNLNDDAAICVIMEFFENKLQKEVTKYYKKEAASVEKFLKERNKDNG